MEDKKDFSEAPESVNEPVGAPVTGEAGGAEEKTEELQEAAAPLLGRGSIAERFKKANEGYDGEPDDESLWQYAERAIGEGEEWKGKYDGVNEANKKLAEVIREEPSVARFIAMISNGVHPMYAIGKCFGNLADKLDEEGLRKLQKGAEERKAKTKEIEGNFEAYGKTLDTYLERHGLTEEDGERINDMILEMADALTSGHIGEEIIDAVYKGLDYDEKREAEEEAAKLEGRNEAIEEIKEKRRDPLPDLVDGKTGGKAPMSRVNPSIFERKRNGGVTGMVKQSANKLK